MKVERLNELTDAQKGDNIREVYVVKDGGNEAIVEMLEDGILDCAFCKDGAGCIDCKHITAVEKYQNAYPIVVIVILDNLVEHLEILPNNIVYAEDQFIKFCEQYVPEWDDFTDAEVQTILSQGYVKFFDGSVSMTFSMTTPI